MGIESALPQAQRDAVEALLRGTDLTTVEIGARTGVSPRTVRTLNKDSGRPRPPKLLNHQSPARWTPERREALARLYREPRNDPGDLAEAVGIDRKSAPALFFACGLIPQPGVDPPRPAARRCFAPLDAVDAANAPALRAQLRAHIAHQIAAFDAALRGEGAAVLDSARVLRDLGGLKRLFDEVAEGNDRDGSGRGERGGERKPEPDVASLRADIARRYARFIGEPEPD